MKVRYLEKPVVAVVTALRSDLACGEGDRGLLIGVGLIRLVV
jgi:hypothetical protein